MTADSDPPDAAGAAPHFRLGGRRPRVMAQSVALDEEGSPRLFRRAAATVMVAVLALTAWAAFLDIDDTVAIPGTVIPGGEVKAVRLSDGGTVAEVLVEKGEIVEEGQILLRLQSGELREELERIKVRRAGVGLLAAGLKALGGGKPPDYSFAEPDHRDLVEKERVVFESIREISDRQRRAVESQIWKLKTEIEEITKRQDALSKQADILEEELQFREDLFKKGLTDKGVYTETKNQVEKAYNDLAELTAERQRVRKTLADAEKRLRAFEVRLRGRVVTELLVVNPVLDGLNETYRQLNDRVSRLTVSAPAGGIVRAAKIPAVGATLEPDATILEIVPLAGETAIEAWIPANDLARVKVGQPVTVTATSGGFAGIPGTLTEIAEVSTTDQRGQVVHKAVITIAGDPLKPASGRRRLTPGTTVEAAVKLGSRPLYADLWRRIAGN
jgi:membrane fusion protein, adhesin transport system